MGTVTFILGESGSGKSASLRNMNPAATLLIQPVSKPLPFKSADWKVWDKEKSPQGNIFRTHDHVTIQNLMRKTSRDVIVLDDFQYVMANEFMLRSEEKGYDKFTEIGRHAWDILDTAAKLPDQKRVYVLSHTNTDESGMTKIKTIGRMLDEKVNLDGLVSIVLRTRVSNGTYKLSTRNSGFDTVKSPMGLFADEQIDNDLAEVDSAIVEYYGLAATNN